MTTSPAPSPSLEPFYTAAATHDIETLHTILKSSPNLINALTPSTSLSALHLACQSATSHLSSALETIRLLLSSGAIWNDLTPDNKTPGCILWEQIVSLVKARGGRVDAEGEGEEKWAPEEKVLRACYDAVVEAGVRAELLLARLAGLGGAEEEEGEMSEDEEEGVAPELVEEGKNQVKQPWEDVDSAGYLASKLEYTADGEKLLDDAGNGVMMEWERGIMEASVEALLPESVVKKESEEEEGMNVLNIGFGMGIVDGMFHDKIVAGARGGVHVISEAHPGVLEELQGNSEVRWPWMGVLADDAVMGYDDEGNEIPVPVLSSTAGEGDKTVKTIVIPGRWQDALASGAFLAAAPDGYDAIYFDTFGEDYAELRKFVEEVVVSCLKPDGRFSWFHGMGADRRVVWDVSTRVAEADCWDAGLEVVWGTVEVEDLGEGKEAREGEVWEGVRRRYWDVGGVYRLPVAKFVGIMEDE